MTGSCTKLAPQVFCCLLYFHVRYYVFVKKPPNDVLFSLSHLVLRSGVTLVRMFSTLTRPWTRFSWTTISTPTRSLVLDSQMEHQWVLCVFMHLFYLFWQHICPCMWPALTFLFSPLRRRFTFNVPVCLATLTVRQLCTGTTRPTRYQRYCMHVCCSDLQYALSIGLPNGSSKAMAYGQGSPTGRGSAADDGGLFTHIMALSPGFMTPPTVVCDLQAVAWTYVATCTCSNKQQDRHFRNLDAGSVEAAALLGVIKPACVCRNCLWIYNHPPCMEFVIPCMQSRLVMQAMPGT